MTINNKIRGKIRYNIDGEVSSGKIDKYEYLIGEEILLSIQRQIIEQAKFAYSPLRKVFGTFSLYLSLIMLLLVLPKSFIVSVVASLR